METYNNDSTMYAQPQQPEEVNNATNSAEANGKKKMAGVIAGGAGSGIAVGAVATWFMSNELEAESLPEAVEPVAEPQPVVVQVQKVQPAPAPASPADTQHQQDNVYINSDEGQFQRLSNGDVVFRHEYVDDNDMVRVQLDVNLDGQYDIEYYRDFPEMGLAELPGAANVEMTDSGHFVAVHEVPINSVVTDFTMIPSTESDIAASDVVETSGGDDVVITSDTGDSHNDDLVIGGEGNGEGDSQITDYDYVDPVDNNSDLVDGGMEPDPYVADVPSDDGMSDFVNDANVDMLA